MREVLTLLIVCGLVALAWWAQRYRKAPAAGVRSVVALGGGARVVSVAIQGRVLMLVVTRQGAVTVLRDDSEGNVVHLMRSSGGRRMRRQSKPEP